MTLLDELKKRIVEIDPEYRVTDLGDDEYDIVFAYPPYQLEVIAIELSKDPDEPEPDTYKVWCWGESTTAHGRSHWSEDPNELQKLIDQATGGAK